MNTTTHPLSTFWLIADRPHARLAALASFLPDAAYLVALAGGLLVHGWRIPVALAEWLAGDESGTRRAFLALADIVWQTWANPAANFVAQKILHNLVLATVFGLVALTVRGPRLLAIALGWMLHVWTDLSLHANDAYAVLWPFTQRVFPAPVSYWDPDHHGRVAGALLSLLAAALWMWLAWRVRRTVAAPRRRRLYLGGCAVLFLASIAGLFGGPPRETRRSDAWVDHGVIWKDEAGGWDLEPAADAIALGEPMLALEYLRAAKLPPTDPDAPPWERNAARARQQLLQGYAQDLRGNREQALVSYALAERLEAVGAVGDKARRYRGEVFRNVPDPVVSRGWLAIFAWGLALSAALLVAVRRQPAA